MTKVYCKCAKSLVKAFPWRYHRGWPISNHEDIFSDRKYLLITV